MSVVFCLSTQAFGLFLLLIGCFPQMFGESWVSVHMGWLQTKRKLCTCGQPPPEAFTAGTQLAVKELLMLLSSGLSSRFGQIPCGGLFQFPARRCRSLCPLWLLQRKSVDLFFPLPAPNSDFSVLVNQLQHVYLLTGFKNGVLPSCLPFLLCLVVSGIRKIFSLPRYYLVGTELNTCI